jgi:hypothetical protein
MKIQDYINSLRVKYALKITTAGIICVLASNIFHLELGYFSLLFVFMIMTQAHGHILRAGAIGFFVTVISGAYGLLITYIFFDSSILYMFLICLWIFLCIVMFNRLFLGSVFGGILTCIILFTTIFVSDLNVTDFAKDYLKQLFLAVVVTSLVDRLVFPADWHRTLHITMSGVFSDFADRFHRLSKREQLDPSSTDEGSASLSLSTFGHILDLITRTSQEHKGFVFPVDAFIKMAACCKDVYRRLELLENAILNGVSLKLDESSSAKLTLIFEKINNTFRSMSEAIVTHNTVSDIDSALKRSTEALERSFISLLDEKGMDEDYHTEITQYGGIIRLIKVTMADLEKIITYFNVVQNVDAYASQTNRKLPRTQTVAREREKKRYEITDENIKQGIRTLIIIFFLLFVMLILRTFFEIPADTQVAFYAVFFGIIPNLGQFQLKSKTGAFGIIFGLIYGLIGLVLVSLIQYFLIVLLLFALGYFLAAYISSGTNRLAFGGLQAGLMMPFVFLIHSGPVVNLDSALQRFAALVIVSFIALIVLNLVWPVNPLNQLKGKLSDAIVKSGIILQKLLKLEERGEDKIKTMVVDLASVLPTSTNLLSDAQYMIRREELHSEEFLEVIDCLEILYLELETLNKSIYRDIDNKFIDNYLNYMSPYYLKIYHCFISVGEQLKAGMNFETPLSEIQVIMKEINNHRVRFRQSGIWKKFKTEDVERVALIVSSIDNILSALRSISLEINQINEPEVITKPVEAV